MKTINTDNFITYLKYPTLVDYSEDLFSGGRYGKKISANTGFNYLKGNDELGSWFELTILGFGLAFYWDFKGKDW